MKDLKLTPEQYQAYNLVELSILMQRSIEILDEINSIDHPLKNKKLYSQLKAIYPSLDKQTKSYNELYEVSSDGISHFYDCVKQNNQYVMNYNLLDKALICSFLVAHEKDSNSVEGIINKVLKR